MSDSVAPEIASALADNPTLVAYRLGRLEKTLEENTRMATARHESLVLKLGGINDLQNLVSNHSLRIEFLEKSRDRLIGIVSVLATGTIMVILNIFFDFLGR